MVKLSRVNSGLLALIIAVNLYIIVAPFAPNLWYWWQQNHSHAAKQLTTQIHTPAPDKQKSENKLIIPSMLLNRPILEGRDTYAILNKGIWRWPDGSAPDRGGNTTLIGHRFTYTNPRGAFYFLNKVRIGDEIGITWSGKMYQYKVAAIKVVPPTDVGILDATAKPTLTLYTCTPLWSPKDRLVVTARLEHIL